MAGDPEPPHVVYHVACMGNWRDVTREQFRLLAESGLRDVRLTHVGPDLPAVLAEAARHGVRATVVRSDPNTDHYETLALFEIDRLAKVEKTARPILYLHTKGVSAPQHRGKAAWRRLMGELLVRRWRENLAYLADHDAVGVNWWDQGEQHFSGNFWLANPAWLRRLPDFGSYHAAKRLVRFSCEMWIGAAQYCRAKSLGCSRECFWEWPDAARFDRILAAAGPAPARPPTRPYVIHAPSYRGNSGGVRALYALCHELRTRGLDATVKDCGGATRTGEACPWDAPAAAGSDRDAVHVVPEVYGSPPHPRVVRWLLNRERHPGAAGERWAWCPAVGPGLPTLAVNPVELDTFRPKDRPGRGTLYYVGKGTFDPSAVPPGSLEIAPDWPADRPQLAELLRRADTLVLFDPLCALAVEAVLCGTPVLLHAAGGGWDADPTAGTAFDLPGVARSPAELDAARAAVGTAYGVYLSRLPGLGAAVDRFVSETQAKWPA